MSRASSNRNSPRHSSWTASGRQSSVAGVFVPNGAAVSPVAFALLDEHERLQAAAVADVARHAADVAKLRSLEIAVTTARWWQRPQQRRSFQRRTDELDRHGALDSRQQAAHRALALHAVGADPRSWDVHSGAQQFHLETSLAYVARQIRGDAHVRDCISAVQLALPANRVAAHNGDLDARGRTRAALHELISLVAPRGEQLARRLSVHLPGDRRRFERSPENLAWYDLDTWSPLETPPVRLSIAWRDVGNRHALRLHDIVVGQWLQGSGFGTAALVELCRFADHHRCDIDGEFIPGPGYNDDAVRVRRTASWYYRYGFRVGERQPEHWEIGAMILRTPSPSSTTPRW